ncbi:MAG: YajQ family cyclic di-GMP-binding protein [Candidatus Kapaibacterium sp.]
MASTFSFDIVSEIDLQEADNAVNQALKEIQQRYDFKGTNSSIELDKAEKLVRVESDDEYRLKQVIDVLESKLIKRGIGLKALTYGTIEAGTKGSARQKITLQSGIDKENAKKLTKLIKEKGLKVQATIQDEQVRVTGKSKDDLQDVIQAIREADLPFDTQFVNYR